MGGSNCASREFGRRDLAYLCALALSIWLVNAIWLALDTRPPVWDMAMHQAYAFNYLPDGSPGSARGPQIWTRSGNYPPLVHLLIAFCYLLFHPGPHIALLANVPATFILLWAVYKLALHHAGRAAARWACLLTALTPYLFWMSRETILDYWLSAFVAAGLVVLHKTGGFRERPASLFLGLLLALGMLTKWLYGGFLFFPVIYIVVRHRVWKYPTRLINLIDALLIAGLLSGIWYLPNLLRLVGYFSANAQIGALEGEPPVLSFQSLIYYLRLLEGYQLFAILFAFVSIACVVAWRRRLLRDGRFLLVAVAGSWLVMTLIRTKDPRFTMPLLALLTIPAGAWMQSWGRSWISTGAKILLVTVLAAQAYMINFGISWLPQSIVLAEGYQGSLRWDWNLYLQHYFHVFGAPRREDWKQTVILRAMAQDANRRGLGLSLALIPDLPRFSAANFHLYARLLGIRARNIDHLSDAGQGVHSFNGFDYVLMTEGDQGMPWTTGAGRALNQIVMDEHGIFQLVDLFPLPNGDSVRLYAIVRAGGQ